MANKKIMTKTFRSKRDCFLKQLIVSEVYHNIFCPTTVNDSTTTDLDAKPIMQLITLLLFSKRND